MSKLLDGLNGITAADISGLIKAERSYGDSWRRRGGIGAFMMLARKWDRIENQASVYGWDIFDAITSDKRPEGIIDDIRDLRRYLLLVEEHLFANTAQVTKEAPDGEAGQGYVNQDR